MWFYRLQSFYFNENLLCWHGRRHNVTCSRWKCYVMCGHYIINDLIHWITVSSCDEIQYRIVFIGYCCLFIYRWPCLMQQTWSRNMYSRPIPEHYQTLIFMETCLLPVDSHKGLFHSRPVYFINFEYNKTCLKRPPKNRQNKCLEDKQ